jgi:large subunit ribosomal protein L17
MRRNLVASLIQHETISTTIEKAKEVKPFAEKLITLAKKGTLNSRRRAIALLGDRDIIDYEEGEPIKKSTIIRKLFSELGPRYLDRPGGYTRIIRLSLKRLGDNGQLVLLQLIGPDESQKKKAKQASKKRLLKKTRKAAKPDEKIGETQVHLEQQETAEAQQVDKPIDASIDKETAEKKETDIKTKKGEK